MGRKRLTDKRICVNCGVDKSVDKYGHRSWFHYKDGYICRKCYTKLIDSPKWNPIKNPRHLRWTPKQKIILVKENPRTGVCSLCHRKVGEGIKRTNMHHFGKYHEDDPLKDTIEICPSCHAFETWKIRKVSE